MYTPYLMFAYSVALALVLLVLCAVQQSVRPLRGVRCLRRYVLCALSAVILLGLPNRAPLLIAEVLPNLLLFAGAVFLYRAIAEILDLDPRLLSWAVVVCAAGSPAIVWFTYRTVSTIGRLEIHCGVLIAVFTMSAVTLLRETRPALRDAARTCAGLLAAMITVNGAWAVYGLLDRPSNFVHPDAINVAFSYLVMILTLGTVTGLGLLSFCVHREELRIAAETDALTGLLNRGAFEQVLRRELERSERGRRDVSVVLLDIDYFKQVNDEHGHLVGDDVLRRIGNALRSGVRPSDVLARFGGEEFVILLRDAPPEGAEEVAERLRADLAGLVDLPCDLNLTGSFGVATWASHETASELLARADEALYRSKREGRNLVRVDGGTPGILTFEDLMRP